MLISYPLDQSALYKVGSKKRLALILNVPLAQLLDLAKSSANYKVFLRKEEICPFTGKKTKERWVQEPKSRLRYVHDRIRKLLSKITAPAYCHSAIKGRSYVTNAAHHLTGRSVGEFERVGTFDIRRYYPSTSRSSIRNFFAGRLLCAPDVADLLTNLCCYRGTDSSLAGTGLPTGSPLSPILSLYANKPMFDTLDELATRHELVFTCYVDDLTFSGAVLPVGLRNTVARVLHSFGHQIASDKTRLFTREQAMHVTGTVIKNKEVMVPHARFKKARSIATAMGLLSDNDSLGRLNLQRKLSGLLGEAAYVDRRYAQWAERSYADLKAVESEVRLLSAPA